MKIYAIKWVICLGCTSDLDCPPGYKCDLSLSTCVPAGKEMSSVIMPTRDLYSRLQQFIEYCLSPSWRKLILILCLSMHAPIGVVETIIPKSKCFSVYIQGRLASESDERFWLCEIVLYVTKYITVMVLIRAVSGGTASTAFPQHFMLKLSKKLEVFLTWENFMGNIGTILWHI